MEAAVAGCMCSCCVEGCDWAREWVWLQCLERDA